MEPVKGQRNVPNHSQQPERLVCLGEMNGIWDKVAADRHLKSDSEVACFLLRYYEDTCAGNQSAACCLQCGTSLSLSCGKCGMTRIQITQQPEGQYCNDKMAPHLAWQEVTEAWATAEAIPSVTDRNDITVTSSGTTAAQAATQMVTRNDDIHLASSTCVQTGCAPVVTEDNCSYLHYKLFPAQTDNRPDRPETVLQTMEDSNALAQENNFGSTEKTAEQIKNPGLVPAIDDSSVGNTNDRNADDTQSIYRCLECGAGFQKKSVMILHLQRHGGRHACQHCGSEFISVLGLTRHLDTGVCKNISSKEVDSITASLKLLKGRQKKAKSKPPAFHTVHTNHDGKRKNVCKFCGKVMSSQSALRRHMLIHTGEKPFGCQECGASFNQRSSLLGHVRHRHAKDKPIKCGACHAMFFSNLELNRHVCNSGIHDSSDVVDLSNIPSAENVTLTQENQVALSAQAVVQSLFTESQDTAVKDNQPSSEDVASSVGQPQVKDTSPEARPHICQYCKAEFASSDLLTNHIQKHTGKKEFKCPYCDAAYGESHHLAKHLRKHTQPKAIMVQCNVCKRTLSGPRSLEQHVCAKCDICQAIFRMPHKLKEHMRTHTGEKPYMCSVCGKSFAKGKYLSQHKKRHAEERTHVCQHCGMAFTTASGLYHHRVKHMDSKPHKCSICSKAYREAYQLTVHMRSHTQEKPYKCSECDARFTMKSILNGHMRTHTGEKPYECSHCGRKFASASNRTAHERTHKHISSQ